MVCQILLFLFFTTIGNLPNIAGVQNNLEKLATIANYSGYKIMYGMVWYGRYRVYVVYGMYLM